MTGASRLLALGALALLGGRAFAADCPSDQATFARLRADREAAHVKRDRTFYDGLLDPAFVLLTPDGRIVERAEYLASEFAAGLEAAESRAQQGPIHGRRSGDLLLVSYEELEATRVGDQRLVEKSARLDTYVCRAGRWRLLSMAVARLPQVPGRIAVAPSKLDDYVGLYAYTPKLTSRVRREGDKLIEQSTGQGEAELVPIGPDLFYSSADPAGRIEFTRGPDGRVTTQVYRFGDQHLVAPRANPAEDRAARPRRAPG